jgi:hypothetical protein
VNGAQSRLANEPRQVNSTSAQGWCERPERVALNPRTSTLNPQLSTLKQAVLLGCCFVASRLHQAWQGSRLAAFLLGALPSPAARSPLQPCGPSCCSSPWRCRAKACKGSARPAPATATTRAGPSSHPDTRLRKVGARFRLPHLPPSRRAPHLCTCGQQCASFWHLRALEDLIGRRPQCDPTLAQPWPALARLLARKLGRCAQVPIFRFALNPSSYRAGVSASSLSSSQRTGVTFCVRETAGAGGRGTATTRKAQGLRGHPAGHILCTNARGGGTRGRLFRSSGVRKSATAFARYSKSEICTR